jgi:hypothetical protein
MPVLGILNGSFREVVLNNFLVEHTAHRVSAMTLIILLFGYGQIIRKRLEVFSREDAVMCGLIWISLTISFEFVFGYFVFDVPYETLLADYNLMEGRLWPLVIFFTGLLPFILRKQTNAS